MLLSDFPIAASFPHFLNGDQALTKSISGLHPSEEKHGSYLIVEPVSKKQTCISSAFSVRAVFNTRHFKQLTGVPVESRARSQSNLVMHPISGFSDIDKFSNMTIPMFWAEYVSIIERVYMYFVIRVIHKTIIYCTQREVLFRVTWYRKSIKKKKQSFIFQFVWLLSKP